MSPKQMGNKLLVSKPHKGFSLEKYMNPEATCSFQGKQPLVFFICLKLAKEVS